MFNSVVLDVAIGLAFIYLLLSLICSALREAVEARLKSRALHLERGIREMLQDADGRQLAQQLYEHPMVGALFAGAYQPSDAAAHWRWGSGLRWVVGTLRSWLWNERGTPLPSYIPSRNFAFALLDLAGRGAVAPDASAAPLTIEGIRAGIGRLPSATVQRAVLNALDTAQGDLDRAIAGVQVWYDSAMERVSGWYKRETQQMLFWLGLVVAIAFNVDTVMVVKHLALSPTARAELVAAATAAAQDDAIKALAVAPAAPAASAAAAPGEPEARLASLRVRLTELNLPIGWDRSKLGVSLLASLPGWLITAFAITFGAPLWFDLLNRLIALRSTMKPRGERPAGDAPRGG